MNLLGTVFLSSAGRLKAAAARAGSCWDAGCSAASRGWQHCQVLPNRQAGAVPCSSSSVSASTSSPLEGIAATPQTAHPSLFSHLSLASGCNELLGAAATHLQSPAGPSDCSGQICGRVRNLAGKLMLPKKKSKKPHDPGPCMNTCASTGEGVGTRMSAAAWLVP